MSDAARRALKKDRCALLVIDMQEKLVPFIFEKERVIRNCKLLLNLAKIAGVPTLLTTQYVKGLGPTIEEIHGEVPEITPTDKLEFGCFGNADFCRRLDLDQKKDTLLVAGIESHICVTQTVLGALEQGFNVHVASDAVSSRTEHNWKIGLGRMDHAGAVISSTEMIIYELLGQSGTQEFKAMLRLLK
jgi:nicotinamidase-related amidase